MTRRPLLVCYIEKEEVNPEKTKKTSARPTRRIENILRQKSKSRTMIERIPDSFCHVKLKVNFHMLQCLPFDTHHYIRMINYELHGFTVVGTSQKLHINY